MELTERIADALHAEHRQHLRHCITCSQWHRVDVDCGICMKIKTTGEAPKIVGLHGGDLAELAVPSTFGCSLHSSFIDRDPANIPHEKED